MKHLYYRLRYRLIGWRWPVHHSTNDSAKWHHGHGTACCICAPDDVCICKYVSREAARRLAKHDRAAPGTGGVG
jgi:hypothetical protein